MIITFAYKEGFLCFLPRPNQGVAFRCKTAAQYCNDNHEPTTTMPIETNHLPSLSHALTDHVTCDMWHLFLCREVKITGWDEQFSAEVVRSSGQPAATRGHAGGGGTTDFLSFLDPPPRAPRAKTPGPSRRLAGAGAAGAHRGGAPEGSAPHVVEASAAADAAVAAAVGCPEEPTVEFPEQLGYSTLFVLCLVRVLRIKDLSCEGCVPQGSRLKMS